MYTYHVFGVIEEETYYFMNNCRSYCSDDTYSEDKWLRYVYNIIIKTTSDHIFERIKKNNRYLSIEDGQYHYCQKIKIPEYILEWNKVLIRQHFFTGKFKEIATITTDIELRDGETIKINDREYRVEYKFNVDKKQHELYIDKVAELIVDEKLLQHAKIVCNEVVKKIIRYNRQVEKEMNKKNEEAQTKTADTITDDETIQKDIDKTELKWYKKLWNKLKS